MNLSFETFEIPLIGTFWLLCCALGAFTLFSNVKGLENVNGLDQAIAFIKNLLGNFFSLVTKKYLGGEITGATQSAEPEVDNPVPAPAVTRGPFSAALLLLLILIFAFIGGSLVITLSGKWLSSTNFYHLGLKYTWVPPAATRDHKVYNNISEYSICRSFSRAYPNIRIKRDSTKPTGYANRDYDFMVNVYNAGVYNCWKNPDAKARYDEYKKNSEYATVFAFSFFTLFLFLFVKNIWNIKRMLSKGEFTPVKTYALLSISMLLTLIGLICNDSTFNLDSFLGNPVPYVVIIASLGFLVYCIIAVILIWRNPSLSTYQVLIPFVMLMLVFGAYNMTCRAWLFNRDSWSDFVFAYNKSTDSIATYNLNKSMIEMEDLKIGHDTVYIDRCSDSGHYKKSLFGQSR